MLMALCRGVGLVLGRADHDAQVAAGAILRRDLDRVFPALEFGRPVVGGLKVGRAHLQIGRARRPWRGWPRAGRPAAHLLHWMQIFGSQIGISAAMVRFSQRAVPVGQVPSTGNAETGSRSPLPASMTAVTRLTKSGASSGTRGGRAKRRRRHASGTCDFVEMRQRVVDGGEIAPHDFLALLARRSSRSPS